MKVTENGLGLQYVGIELPDEESLRSGLHRQSGVNPRNKQSVH